MQIVHHAPVARGVSQLMYVGDVVDPPGIPLAVKIAAVLAVGWLLFVRKTKR
jgi:hypothetical protein